MAATTSSTPDTLDRATEYARAVAAGIIVAGPHVRAQCARHLRDLENGPKRGLTWSLAKATRAIAFVENKLRLNGGQFEGVPFLLQPWQAFIVGSLFGWLRADGMRRFRLAFIETGKGSGKSPLAAAIGLYMLTADREARAEVYAAASKRDQALVLFRDAIAFYKQSPELLSRLKTSGGEGVEWNLAFHATGSYFRVISSEDGQSGPRPHCALLDEIHEHRDDTVVEMMQAGTKFRLQPLIIMITNSGSDRTGVCFRYHTRAIKIAAGAIEDDSFFTYVCAVDEGDDPMQDESCWPKANPNLGVTFGVEFLRARVNAARSMPSVEAKVRRLHFCEWTDAVEHWIGSDLWMASEKDFDLDEVRELPCFLGLDLSSKRDLTALSAAWVHPDGQISTCTWFWTPRETMGERAKIDNVPYDEWVAAEHLFAPEGRRIDKAVVATFVQGLCDQFDVRALAYDQAQMEDFLAALDELGVVCWIYKVDEAPSSGLLLVRHGQGFAGYSNKSVLWMPRSIETLEARIVKKTIWIKPNPCLRWNSASAVLENDEANNRKWLKRKSTGRIDGMTSLSEAIGLADSGIAESAYLSPDYDLRTL